MSRSRIDKTGTAEDESGVVVCQKPKADVRLQPIPVAVTTGISEDFKRSICTRRQLPKVDGYFGKSVDHNDSIAMTR